MPGGRLASFVVVVAMLAGGAARAGGPEAAAAEVAFDKGRDQMKAGLFSEACASFDESERLDPQIGTLYNLADCWERVGKLASAWTAFREVAQRDNNATRRKAADEHAQALTKRMPKLVIKLTQPPPDVVVTLNGGDITKLVGIEAPMDLGTYAIVVSAKGFQAWGGEAKVVQEGQTITVVVPALAPGSGKRPPTPVATTTTTTKPPPQPTKPPPPPPTVVSRTTTPPMGETKPAAKGTTATTTTGTAALPPSSGEADEGTPEGNRHGKLPLIVASASGAFVIGGVVAGALANSKLSDAEKICPGKTCASSTDASDANALLRASRTRGDISTALVIVGGAGLVTSGILWWTGRPHGEHAPRAAIAPVVAPGVAGVVLEGRF